MAIYNTIREQAALCGLTVARWSPGDGKTRYRFFSDGCQHQYDEAVGCYTALGSKEALVFLKGFYIGMKAQQMREVCNRE